MRKHSRRIKTRKYGGSRKLRGGNLLRRAGQFLGFGRSPAEAQALSDTQQEDADINSHNADAETKRVEAENLRRQCQDYEQRASDLDLQVRDHLNSAAVIGETRALKTRCDEEHAGRLQQIEQDHQRQLEQIQQEHNRTLEAANQAQETRKEAAIQRERNELQNCLAGTASLLPPEQARQADTAATALQSAVRQRQARDQTRQLRTTLAPVMQARRDMNEGLDPLGQMVPEQGQFGGPMDGGRRSRRGGRKSRRGGRKSRRGGRKSRRGGRKSRRGGNGCGTHKKKMMYAGRKSRRGGGKCSPKLGKKCPHYKKYGKHK